MSLTGLPLIVLAVCCTAVVVAATVWSWGRWRPVRFVLRPAGVLLSEALLLVTIGLVVNRSEQFYPSWAALFAPASTGVTSYKTVAGTLDQMLTAQAAGHLGAP